MPSRDDPVLIFDGDCAFCIRCVRWLEARWTRTERPVARASQSIDDESLSSMSLTRNDVQRAAWWIEDGRAFEGHLAVAMALRSCSGAWRAVGIWLERPLLRWLGALIYPLVVRYRRPLSRAARWCSRQATAPRAS